VQYHGGANVCAQMFSVVSDGIKYLRSSLHQQAIHIGFVVKGQLTDGGGQSEYHMVVIDRQQLALPCFEASFCRKCLAFGTMTVST
jgi:hypothetical protein